MSKPKPKGGGGGSYKKSGKRSVPVLDDPELGQKTGRDILRLKNIVGKVAEDSKIRLDEMIGDFLAHPELKEVTLPNQLTNMERAYVHFQASKNGLKSFSTGNGTQRRLTLRRAAENTTLDAKSVSLTTNSLQGIGRLVQEFPPEQSYPKGNKLTPEVFVDMASNKVLTSRLSNGQIPMVPKPRRSGSFYEYQRKLPISTKRREILEKIENNNVVFIRGSTGCGKTTQVAQFLLDDAAQNSKRVRIICTVPRRIAAITVSERVAQERGERLGDTVGYQIRLESCISPTKTLLTYCTSGILLRSMTAPDYMVLQKTTHIIIDEIHERDRQTDFLLAILRDILVMFPHLRLILMGADMNNELFSNYFGGEKDCPMIQIEGRIFQVDTFYLEDVLEMLNYENGEMKNMRRHEDKEKAYSRLVEKLQGPSVTDNHTYNGACSTALNLFEVSPEVDNMIQKVWINEDEEALKEFISLVSDQAMYVNYQHSEVGVTMLMAATVHGLTDEVKTLLMFGADINLKSLIEGTEFSAIDWATDHRQNEVLKVLLEHQYSTKVMPSQGQPEDSEKSRQLANYLKTIDEDRVDLLLVLRLLHHLHINADPNNAILVFLPGYDEIVNLKHLILTDNQLGFRHGSFLVFMLHSNIQTGDQRAAFDKPPNGVRKIVLSTNIAESSLTIEDIVFVIDSGKAKEKSFDSMTCVTQLKSVWISKASVNQRRGRAGRCRRGKCFHLFSSARYQYMPEFPIPEIIRTSLQELSLSARSLMREDVKIDRFFSRLPEPPAPIAVAKSVDLLKAMGALNEEEKLTRLGFHLLDFPLEPFLGKAIIYATVFRCLDPILTLVSVISYRDPFQLPSDPRNKQNAQDRKAKFARDSLSDHMAYLKAFQDWENAKLFNYEIERRFCYENFVSSATFEMVYAIRTQLLGQLRAKGFVKTKGRGDIKDLNINSGNWPLVKGVLVATLYPNICGLNREKKVLYNSYNSKIAFHPSTTVAKKKNDLPNIMIDWIVFDEMTQQGPTTLVKGCTCVSTAAVALFAGGFNHTEVLDDEDDELEANDAEGGMHFHSSKLKINQWITLHGTKETINNLMYLRQQINALILRKLESPNAFFTPEEEATIQAIAMVLVNEDKSVGFKSVEGIEQWPKYVTGNFMSAPSRGFSKSTGNGSGRRKPGPRLF